MLLSSIYSTPILFLERARSRSSGGGGGSFTDDGGGRSPRGWSRSRTLSVSYGGSDALSPGGEGPGSVSGGGGIPEELTLDYAEISSVPPLPLWTLLAADKETGGGNSAAGGVTGAGDKGAELRVEKKENSLTFRMNQNHFS